MNTVRLREVAEAAGVSVSTASAALRGLPIVRESTRTQVESVASRLGYRKHSAAAALSRTLSNPGVRSTFLAHIRFPVPGTSFGGPSGFHDILKEEAEGGGIHFELRAAHDAEEAASILRELEAKGCDGVIAGPAMSPEFDDLAEWDRFAIVSTQAERLTCGFDVVQVNHFSDTYRLLETLRDAGYRRIGVCLRHHSRPLRDDRMGFGAACAFVETDVDADRQIPPTRLGFRDPEGDTKIQAWVERWSPDIVVGFNPGDYHTLKRLGYRIPEDLAYVALHAGPDANIAGLEKKEESLARLCFSILQRKIAQREVGRSREPVEFLTQLTLRPGLSCPQLTPTASI